MRLWRSSSRTRRCSGRSALTESAGGENVASAQPAPGRDHRDQESESQQDPNGMDKGRGAVPAPPENHAEARPPRVRAFPRPIEQTRARRELHNLSHYLREPWCRHRVEGLPVGNPASLRQPPPESHEPGMAARRMRLYKCEMTGKRKIVPRVRARHQPSQQFKTRRTRRPSTRKPTSHKLVRKFTRQGFRTAAAAQAKSQPVAHLWPSWFLGDAHQWAEWQKSGLTRGRYPAWRAKYLNRRMSDLRQEVVKPRVEEDDSEQPDAKRHRRGNVDGDGGGEESRLPAPGPRDTSESSAAAPQPEAKRQRRSIQSPPSDIASIVELDS